MYTIMFIAVGIVILGVIFFIGMEVLDDIFGGFGIFTGIVLMGIVAVLIVHTLTKVPEYTVVNKLAPAYNNIELVSYNDTSCSFQDSNGVSLKVGVDKVVLGAKTRVLSMSTMSTRYFFKMPVYSYKKLRILEVAKEDLNKKEVNTGRSTPDESESKKLYEDLVRKEIEYVFGKNYLEISSEKLTAENVNKYIESLQTTEIKDKQYTDTVLAYNKLDAEYIELLAKYQKLEQELEEVKRTEKIDTNKENEENLKREIKSLTDELHIKISMIETLESELTKRSEPKQIENKPIEGKQIMLILFGVATVAIVMFLGYVMIIKTISKNRINEIKARTESEVHKMIMSDNKYIPECKTKEGE